MRIGTWNLERATGGDRNERRLARLREAAADLWVLTETHDDVAPLEHRAVAAAREDGRHGERWVAIFSRWPLTTVATDDPSRTVAALVADSPHGPLLVYGTVMPWHSDAGREGTARNWSEHHKVVSEQGQEWVRLLERHPGAGLCVAGDFNMSLATKHFYGTQEGRRLLRAALATAGLSCVTEAPLVPGKPLEHPPIDHICLNADLALGARVIDAWEGESPDGGRLSDHSGLVVYV